MNMTLAQVYLMAVDQSIIVYPKQDEVKMANGKVRKFNRLTKDDLEETNRWWAEKQRKRKERKQSEERD